MKSGFPFWPKVFVAFGCFVMAIAGFMIKLPSGFRHIDKELHAAFYFLAAAFLNLLFAKTKIARHVIIFISLYILGIIIEYAQAYSNRFFRKRIHGRFDPEDVQSNLNGLIAFSMLWILGVIIMFAFKRAALKTNELHTNQ
ncbi:MAG: hypothetical protein V4717_03665 [Bacteroidota bacterium]